MLLTDVTVVIPSLNPDEKLRKTVQSLLALGFHDIILVNDGSAPETVSFFPTDLPCCTLLTHSVNLGKGAALKTAFRYILERKTPSHGVVTVDGDGQHTAKDTQQCAELMLTSGKIILGVRDFSGNDVPARSRMGNRITSLVFRLLCGIRISDTQTGLRAIPVTYLPDMLTVNGDRYEYETNMLLNMQARGIPYGECPIETVYIEENKTSHFRPFRDSLRIYSLILKFISSSLIASLIDLGVFFVLSLFLPGLLGTIADAVSTAVARIVSSGVNYTINRTRVFGSTAPARVSLVRYYILAAGILVLSSVSISLLSILFHLQDSQFALIKTFLKFVIDSVLFLISFRAQREWVFARTERNAPESH